MFRFLIQNKITGEQRKFERPLFPQELRSQLAEFVEHANVLNECSFVRNWPQMKISIHMGNDGQISNTGVLPSDEEIAAFFHRLRPFYLQRELTNFNRIANSVSHHLNDPAVTDCIRHWKRYHSGRASQEVLEIAVGGKIVNSEEFFDHYVNALEYHRDKARRQHVEAVAEHFPFEAQRPIIVLLLSMRLNAINKLSSFLLTCFDREDGRPLTLQMA